MMKRMIKDALALGSFLLVFMFCLQASAEERIIAEKVSWESLRPGDEFLIVFNDAAAVTKYEESAQDGKYLESSPVAVNHTATRTVIVEGLPDDAAVFTCEEAEDGVYLHCESGYLTASPEDYKLYYVPEADSLSVWQISEGEYLYNPNVAFTQKDGSVQYGEYLSFFSNSFTIYKKDEGSNPSTFQMSFYKIGNSKPEEGILEDSYYTLPLFETSDIHGYLADMSEGESEYLLAYISDKVKDLRGGENEEDQKRVILLDGGDIFQGNTMSNVLNGAPLSAAFQIMGYDAVTIGNHDFDWGIENVIDADGTLMDPVIGGTQTVNSVPVIMSNLYQNGEKVTFASDYIILEKTAYNKEGESIPVKVGVIGFAGDYSKSVIKKEFDDQGFHIKEDFDVLNELSLDLETNQGCDATILLTHEDAQKVSSKIGEDSVIDLVLGGHTHRSENGSTSWGLQYLEPAGYSGAYCSASLAFSAGNSSGEEEETEKSGDHAVSFEEILYPRVFSLTDLGNLLTEPEAGSEELDTELVALTDQTIDLISDILDEEVGYITQSVFRQESNMEDGVRVSACGNWMSSIIQRIGEADVGLINKGAMRIDFPLAEGASKRTITVSDIYTMFPFADRICTYTLTYGEFLTALEYMISESGHILFTYMTGIDCYYTGETVNAIVRPDGTLVYHNGVWEDDWENQKIRVAMNEYCATTNRKSETMENPFIAWSSTDRFEDPGKIDQKAAVEVLEEEAKNNDGLLSVDMKAHFIAGDVPSSETESE